MLCIQSTILKCSVCQIVHLSPTEDSYGESLCTLRFASQVNSSSSTSSLRSMSQTQTNEPTAALIRTPSLSSRSPSFGSNKEKSVQQSGNSVRRPSGDVVPPISTPPGTPKSSSRIVNGGIRSGSFGSSPPQELAMTPESAEKASITKVSPTKSASIARVFTFAEFDDATLGEQTAKAKSQSPSKSLEPRDGIGTRPPLSPMVSTVTDASQVFEESTTPKSMAPLASPVSSFNSRIASQSNMGLKSKSTSGEFKNLSRPEMRRAASGTQKQTSVTSEIKKTPTRSSYVNANSIPTSPKPLPSPTKRPLPNKPKSTF